MAFDNTVLNWRGGIEGYLCDTCLQVKPRMWGTVCNECRDRERRHRELLEAIRQGKKEQPHDEQ